MQIIILSGGSGSRLWPLSNDARSKQFLKILPNDDGRKESMLQRVVRQIKESGIECDISVETAINQYDLVYSQVGNQVTIITEPFRRKTFPAVCLVCQYLRLIKKCSPDELIIVIPCDVFTTIDYFKTIEKMANGIKNDFSELILMGITPISPTSDYGYIVPKHDLGIDEVMPVISFVEKPGKKIAQKLIDKGALWNGGVFAFRLSLILGYCEKIADFHNYKDYLDNFTMFPSNSFDHEVVENCKSLGVVKFEGAWKDLGTWELLSSELADVSYGNVICDNCRNTHILNELNIPVLVLGTENLIIAASPDGIVVADKCESDRIKNYVGKLKDRPMYEERRWGNYKVLDRIELQDGYSVLTKQLVLNPGASISYQKHQCRDEVWTIVDGDGEIIIDGKRSIISRGSVIVIEKGTLHALRAESQLTLIEVQKGCNLVETDIERFAFEW